MKHPSARPARTILALALLFSLFGSLGSADAMQRSNRSKKEQGKEEDPYALYVWPPPPDKPRIKLEAVARGRADVEASSGFVKMLIGMEPKSKWDDLQKPYDVAFDPQGRVLVTDSQTSAVLRFDFAERKFDVFGTKGVVQLKLPLGLDVAADGEIFVADIGLGEVVAFSADGGLKGSFRAPEYQRPVDVVASRDGKRLYVADSLAHKVWITDRQSGRVTGEIGGPGEDPGEFHSPTALALTPEGNLAVVDQLNGRVQLFTADGEPLGVLGSHGKGLGYFERPKGVAVDEVGFIYVTDFLQGIVQLFDFDFTLLTFVGGVGNGPGQFDGVSGIAVRGDRFAVVDQLGTRVQVFRFIVPKSEE